MLTEASSLGKREDGRPSHTRSFRDCSQRPTNLLFGFALVMLESNFNIAARMNFCKISSSCIVKVTLVGTEFPCDLDPHHLPTSFPTLSFTPLHQVFSVIALLKHIRKDPGLEPLQGVFYASNTSCREPKAKLINTPGYMHPWPLQFTPVRPSLTMLSEKAFLD